MSGNVDWGLAQVADNDRWWKAWPELGIPALSKKKDPLLPLDPVMLAADFYITEGLSTHRFLRQSAGIPLIAQLSLRELGKILHLSEEEIADRIAQGSSQPSLSSPMLVLAREAQDIQEELVRNSWQILWAYLQAACGGELRYMLDEMPDRRDAAWCGWRKVYDDHRADALVEMIEAFKTVPDSADVGGARWAEAATLLLLFERGELGPNEYANKKMLVDRIIALEHNHGCMLSKRKWMNLRGGRSEFCGWMTVEDIEPIGTLMRPLLDCHSFVTPNLTGLYRCASSSVQSLTTAYIRETLSQGLELDAIWEQGQQASGVFSFKFTLKKVLDADGEIRNSDVIKLYEFDSLDEAQKKKFHFSHMLKASSPGGRAVEVLVSVGTPTGFFSVGLGNDEGLKFMTGQDLLQLEESGH